jgi:hypothetical protein
VSDAKDPTATPGPQSGASGVTNTGAGTTAGTPQVSTATPASGPAEPAAVSAVPLAVGPPPIAPAAGAPVAPVPRVVPRPRAWLQQAVPVLPATQSPSLTTIRADSPVASLVALASQSRPQAPIVLPMSTPLPLTPVAAVRGHTARPTASPAHDTKPEPSGNPGDERGPGSPLGPPGRSSFGAGTTAPGGGVASGLWCAILIALLAYAARDLRRHRHRFVLLEPVGFASPQQRPG